MLVNHAYAVCFTFVRKYNEMKAPRCVMVIIVSIIIISYRNISDI